MPIPNFPSVEPGDLITAELMTGVINSLKDLEERVKTLESATGDGTVTITNISGVATPIRVNSRVTATGTNFAQPAVLNAVTVDGLPVLNLSAIESNSTQLVFDAPAVANLPTDGKLVTLQVTNLHGTATRQFTLAPFLQVPNGNIQVLYTTAPVLQVGQTIVFNQSYIFTFRITAFASMAASYLVQASITGANGWTTQVLQENSDTAGTGVFNFPGVQAGSSKDVRIRVTVGPIGGAGTLNVNVGTQSASQVLPGNASIIITPGQLPPTPETRVRIALSSPTPVAGRVQFQRNQIAAVAFVVSVTQSGVYNLTAAMRNPTGWTPNGVDVTQFTVSNNPPAGTTANTPINAAFTPGATAAETDLIFTVTRSNDISVPYSLPVSVTG